MENESGKSHYVLISEWVNNRTKMVLKNNCYIPSYLQYLKCNLTYIFRNLALFRSRFRTRDELEGHLKKNHVTQ